MGESGGASKIGCSWPWSEFCLWVEFFIWQGFGADPAPFGDGVGFSLDELAPDSTDKLLGVVVGWFDVASSVVELTQVVVLLRLLTEPDFIRKKAPLS